jgi:hypothetical protein
MTLVAKRNNARLKEVQIDPDQLILSSAATVSADDADASRVHMALTLAAGAMKAACVAEMLGWMFDDERKPVPFVTMLHGGALLLSDPALQVTLFREAVLARKDAIMAAVNGDHDKLSALSIDDINAMAQTFICEARRGGREYGVPIATPGAIHALLAPEAPPVKKRRRAAAEPADAVDPVEALYAEAGTFQPASALVDEFTAAVARSGDCARELMAMFRAAFGFGDGKQPLVDETTFNSNWLPLLFVLAGVAARNVRDNDAGDANDVFAEATRSRSQHAAARAAIVEMNGGSAKLGPRYTAWLADVGTQRFVDFLASPRARTNRFAAIVLGVMCAISS